MPGKIKFIPFRQVFDAKRKLVPRTQPATASSQLEAQRDRPRIDVHAFTRHLVRPLPAWTVILPVALYMFSTHVLASYR